MKAVTWDDIPVELITNSVERRVLWGSKGTFAQLTLADGTYVARGTVSGMGVPREQS